MPFLYHVTMCSFVVLQACPYDLEVGGETTHSDGSGQMRMRKHYAVHDLQPLVTSCAMREDCSGLWPPDASLLEDLCTNLRKRTVHLLV